MFDDEVVKVKATFEICKKCQHCLPVKKAGGKTYVVCMVDAPPKEQNAFLRHAVGLGNTTLENGGDIIGVLKEGKGKEPRFSSRGDWHVPANCCKYTEQMFSEIDKKEEIAAKKGVN